MLNIFLGAIGKADQRNGRLFKSTYTSTGTNHAAHNSDFCLNGALERV